MKIRTIIYAITLAAYGLYLAHSMIPHHHHPSHGPARSHHSHHDHGAGHDHTSHHATQDNEDPNQHNFFSFFIHGANADITLQHASPDQPVKGKKIHIDVRYEPALLAVAMTSREKYGRPKQESSGATALYRASYLRAPPPSA